MPPAAVLRVLVQAAGIADTNKQLMSVHDALTSVDEQVNETIANLDRLGDVNVTATAGLDAQDVTGKLAEAHAALDDFGDASVTAKASVDVGDVTENVGEAMAALDDFSHQVAIASLNVDDRGAVASIAGANADLDKIAARHVTATVKVNVDSAQANAQLAALSSAGSGSNFSLKDLQQTLSGMPGAFSGTSAAVSLLVIALLALGGPIFAVISALAPLVGIAAGAGSSLLALAQGFGVLKLATSGISAALKESTTDQQSAGSAASTSGQQQRAAAQQIASAMDGLRTAKEGVTTATTNLAAAEQAYQTATQTVSQVLSASENAELSLADARTQGARALDGIHTSLERATTDEAQAVLGLVDAKNALAGVLAGTTPEDLAKAQASVTGAVDDQAQAVLNLQKAQAQAATDAGNPSTTALQQAQDLLDVKAAQDAVTQSTFGLTDAQKALQAAQAGPSDEDKQKALLAVATAQQALTAAQGQGAAAAQGVTNAQRQLADANANVTKAVAALADAEASASAGAQQAASSSGNLHKALDALSPPAQAFVQTLLALKPRLDDLKAAAAGGFFPGATAGLDAAMGSFSAVKQVVSQTASALGQLTQRAGEMVGSPAWSGSISSIGDNNARALGTFGDAGLKLADALRYVLVAAEPLETWMAKLTDRWAESADQAAKTGEQSGKLADFFQRTQAVATTLFSIIGNLVGGLMGLGHAGEDSGNRILASISAAAAKFNEWANSVSGQQSISKFFAQTEQFARELVPALAGVASAFTTIGIGPFSEALRIAGPYAKQLTEAFLAWKVAATIINGIGDAMKAYAKIQVLANAAIEASSPAFWALNAAMDANPIGLVVIAIATLVAGLVLAYTHFQAVRDIVSDVWSWIKDNWPLLVDIVLGPIGIIVTTIISNWGTIKDATVAVWDAITSFLTGAWDTLSSTATSVFDTIRNAITTSVDTVKAAIQAAWDFISTSLSATWHAILATASAAWDAVRDAILTPLDAARDGLTVVLTAIATRLTAAWDTVKAAATAAWDVVSDAILSALRTARDALDTVLTGISDRLGAAWSTVEGAATTAWDAVRDAILTPLDAARDAIPEILKSISGVLDDGWTLIKKGVSEFGSDVGSIITGAITDAGNAVVGLVNDIIGVIDILPGVSIGKVKGLARGGELAATGASDGPAGVAAFAQGGAFGMTGGIVNAPIAIMGEEAPAYPEVVIPTNPAYRGRAQQLAAYAAHAVGIPGYAAGGILGTLEGGADALWGLVSGGVGGLLGKLPGVGDLPSWVQGLGSWAVDHMTSWIKDKFASLFGAGGNGGGGLAGVMKAATDLAAQHFPYVYGGGHGDFSLTPVDCSGGVSYALHGGNLMSSPETTDGLKVYGDSGDGKTITIGVRGSTGMDAHTMMEIAGRYFESGGAGGHGWEQVPGWDGVFPIHRHPTGYAAGGILEQIADQAFAPDVVGWGLAQGGLLGSFQSGTDYVPRTGPYLLHQGESVTPASNLPLEVELSWKDGSGGPGSLENLIGGMIDVKIKRDGRDVATKWKAGKR